MTRAGGVLVTNDLGHKPINGGNAGDGNTIVTAKINVRGGGKANRGDTGYNTPNGSRGFIISSMTVDRVNRGVFIMRDHCGIMKKR